MCAFGHNLTLSCHSRVKMENLEHFLKIFLTKRNQSIRKRKRIYTKHMRQVRAAYENRSKDLFMQLLTSLQPIYRSCEFIPRSDNIWLEIMQNYSEERWVEDFRVSKSTFNYLCSELRSKLEPAQNPIFNNARTTSVEKQIAISLFKLASCGEYRVVGNVFGIHKCTVKKIVFKVVEAILDKLIGTTIVFPDEQAADDISAQFEEKCKLPQVIGCIDGTHIPITAPSNGRRDFTNRKGYASIVLQAVVDHSLLFRDISCKLPGSSHDATAFKESSLFKNKDEVFPKRPKNIEGKEVDFYLIGDPAYPLLPFLMKDYPGSNLNDVEENFNVRLNSARVKVEIAFGRLKSRWRILSKKSDIDYKFMPKVVGACCVLHNLIESSSNDSTEEYTQKINGAALNPAINSETETNSGKEIRNHLAKYLANSFELRKQH